MNTPEENPGNGSGVSTLIVDGLDCASCAASVDRAIRSLEGVEEVHADVLGERVTVRYSTARLGEQDLRGAIARAGYRVRATDAPTRTVYEVEGLCCATEARQIESRLGDHPDVHGIEFDYVGKRMVVDGAITPREVQEALTPLGLRPRRVDRRPPHREQHDTGARSTRIVLVVLSGIFWAAAMLADVLFTATGLATALSLGALVAGGWYIVPRGLKAARNRALDMNFLMTIAAVGAIAIGEHLEGASAMFLFAFAQLLEARTMDRARNAIRSLMRLSPAIATVVRDEGEVRIAAEDVEVGDLVIVRPGEKIPIDGRVVDGRSAVNQAPITGESMPAEKAIGSEVFAGTINGEGVLEVLSTRSAEDTTLARIIHAVEDAQSSRAPSQAFVDRFARIYTPAVVVVAALIALLPPLLGLGEWSVWIYRALVLLVVACPCALVISTPVTIVSALAGAARRGILIKGGLHLETAGRVRVLAVDKTGTLTEGEPAVMELIAVDGTGRDAVLGWAAAAERRSDHPVARAIQRHAVHRGVDPLPAAEITAIPGKGMRALVDGRIVYVGTERLFRELGVQAVPAATTDLEDRGMTTVLVGTAPGPEESVTVRGIIGVSDRVRPAALPALEELRADGFTRIVMLTGDNRGTARAVAEGLPPIDEFRSELLPEDKVRAVRELRERHGTIAFIGDGINDAPALAGADVGVAMGSAGTDVALETADIALMSDDLSRLPVMFRMARKAETIIRANIAISLLTKAAFVALAVLGLATLWMAVAADMGTSLVVILNGMRAMRAPQARRPPPAAGD